MARISKRERSRLRGKSGIELIDESVHLLRSAPVTHLVWYFAGTLPFVLALLYFWGDMSRSPFAAQHLVGGALTLSALFLWMKTCQAIFSRLMRSLISGHRFSPTSGKIWRTFVAQAAFQPSGLFVIPLALVPALPFAWVYAFYQNVGALDDGQSVELRVLARKATNQAFLWPGQNHVALSIMTAFGFFVALNLMAACFILPGLVKMLFGIETVFTRSGLSMLNMTFFAAVFALTYLCVDPVLKTIYALRCFYGESQRSGTDLRAELRLADTARLASTILSILVLALIAGASNVVAGEPGPTPVTAAEQQSSLPTAELDRTIQQVIQQPKYAWRQPRAKLVEADDGQKGFFARLLERVKPFVVKCLKAIGRWLDAFFRRLFARQRAPGSNDIASRWVSFMHLLLYGLIAATALGLIWLLYRVWQSRRKTTGAVASEPIQTVPDLSDENLGADQLPEDGWMALAQKLLAEGELRLALRSFYLASLAQLASNNLIQLARFKSNRDYERELQRRAHALPELVVAFGENLSVFDRSWYGLYDINREIVEQFAQNVARIRGAVGTPAGTPAAQ